MANNALKKITTRAKQLQKKYPNTAWKNLIKKAGAEYRSGHLKSVSVSRKRKKKTVSGFRSKKKKSYNVKREISSRSEGAGLTIAAAQHFIKKELEAKLGRQEIRFFNATTKTAKRQIRKEISETKKALRKIHS